MPIFATTVLSVKANYSQFLTFFTFLSFQKQVFLEDRDCASGMLKSQGLARAVSGWVLEGCSFDAGRSRASSFSSVV
jgi:hypothetical protein